MPSSFHIADHVGADSTQSGHPTPEIGGREAVVAGCSRGRGTSVANCCKNSSGLMTRCVVPSRRGVLSLSHLAKQSLAGAAVAEPTAPSAASGTPDDSPSGARAVAPRRLDLDSTCSAHGGCSAQPSRGIAPLRVDTLCPARAPMAIRYVTARDPGVRRHEIRAGRSGGR